MNTFSHFILLSTETKVKHWLYVPLGSNVDLTLLYTRKCYLEHCLLTSTSAPVHVIQFPKKYIFKI